VTSDTVRTAVFTETGERRKIKSRCRVCYPPGTTDDQQGCVSANGVEHVGTLYGMTFCGKDATRHDWWWPA
jgi:hypothetical protein